MLDDMIVNGVPINQIIWNYKYTNLDVAFASVDGIVLITKVKIDYDDEISKMNTSPIIIPRSS